MTPRLLLVIFLMTFKFHSIQNELRTYPGFFLYTEMKSQSEMKEVKATLFSESMSTEEEGEDISSSSHEDEMFQMKNTDEQRKTNRLKREAVTEIITAAVESHKSPGINEGIKNPKIRAIDSSKNNSPESMDKIKRQTSIKGNGNRLSNLINLPVKLNVLANVLSQLNQGVIDTKEKPLASKSIIGNDNVVSSLVNAPIDADAILNVLGTVDRTQQGASVPDNKDKNVVGGILSGLLGGNSEKADQGLVGGLLGGLLGGVDGSGLLESVLGDTLGDLLGGLLGNDGLVGNLLGGASGTDLVTELLDGLLGGVTDLVDSLLDLLVGILEGLLHGLDISNVGALGSHPTQTSGGATNAQTSGSRGLHITGNNNRVSSLINAPIRIKALINVLGSLRQEMKQQVDPAVASGKGVSVEGNNNKISSLINVPADVDLNVNLISSLIKNSTSGARSKAEEPQLPVAPGSSPGSSSSISSSHGSSSLAATANTNIKGNKNILSSILNVVPDVDLNLNILSEVTELLGGIHGKDSSGADHPGNNPNQICFDIPISQTDTSITGDNNKISNAVNIQPKIHIDLNLLSKIKQTGDSNVPTQRVCITKPVQPLPGKPTTHIPIVLKPTPSTAIPALPSSTIPTVPKPVPSPLPVSTTPSSPGEICFDILVDQSGTVINGNNNQISSLINVDPKINLDLNLLSHVQKPQTQANLTIKRICIPSQTTPTPAPILIPTTKAPIYPPAGTRCFRRTCTKWKHFVDYNCANKPNEYPKITYTMDV